MVAGDTQVVYGPHVFSTPNGRPTNYVEALSLVVQPTRRYTLRLVNGAADGTQRATSGSLSLNGKLLFQGPDFSSGATLTRVVEPLSADSGSTTRVSVAPEEKSGPWNSSLPFRDSEPEVARCVPSAAPLTSRSV